MDRSQITCAVGFAFLGGASRLHFLWTQTREQILAVCMAVVIFEIVVPPMLGVPRSAVGMLLNAAAATFAMVAVRVTLEGWPIGLTRVIAWLIP